MLETAKVRMVIIFIIAPMLVLITFSNGFSQIVASDGLSLLPNESDIPGYMLKRQYRGNWVVGKGDQLRETIRQTWSHIEDEKEVRIEVCVFDSEIQAKNGVNYERTHIQEHLWWGSFTGNIIGEKSWIGTIAPGWNSVKGVILFVQNNVGVKINGGQMKKEDLSFLYNIAERILQRILAASSSRIPEDLKAKQISAQEYETQIQKVTQTVLKDFTYLGEKDSKWIIDEQHFLLGRYREWADNGKVIGIDICIFDSLDVARRAAKIRSQEADAPILEAPISEVSSPLWNSRMRTVTNASAIIVKGKKVIHLYQFNQEGINRHLFKELSENLD